MLEKLFPREPAATGVKEYFKTLTAYQPVFRSYSGSLYEMDATRAAIHAIATHSSKLKPNVIGSGNKKLERMLQMRPNPWQTTSQFLYRTRTILEADNTVFIIPIYDGKNARPSGVFSVLPSTTEVVTSGGVEYLRFEFARGQRGAMEWSKVGVLTKMQYASDLFGSDNSALKPTLNLLSVQNQGIQEGIKQAAAIRFMAKLGQTLRSEDLKKEQENFRALNLGTDNSGGVMMFDAKYADVKQIDSKPYIVDAEQMKLINNNVYNYFGVNEKILRNEWDETAWDAFYEGNVEPFALQLSLVLTGMFFSDKEVAFGNEIQLSSNRLQFASTKDKMSVITEMFDRGMLSSNEGREIMQMAPYGPDGDKRFIRGEYVGVDTKLAEAGSINPLPETTEEVNNE